MSVILILHGDNRCSLTANSLPGSARKRETCGAVADIPDFRQLTGKSSAWPQGLLRTGMSHTALTVPSMNELLKRRFDVTVTVARDGSYLPDPAAFSIAAEAAAATRPVTGVMSAHCPDKIIGCHRRDGGPTIGGGRRPDRRVRRAKASGCVTHPLSGLSLPMSCIGSQHVALSAGPRSGTPRRRPMSTHEPHASVPIRAAATAAAAFALLILASSFSATSSETSCKARAGP